ncbi:tol protein [Pyrenophora tritici-repentis Pt-1C-BFP]|uniref:Tol protein n=1 Tax=Pyrenophora tritici-repentis (strain Pt-1C-BFP) TaxID=426418 RepID=B2W514_PYRTR|nr:tol protein [Pyrenophora tritici-repentis Pt-1C-BFP]EDU47621.1 tol protein [Pyrenophora tritici-repentis Pt-1C-BFP]
MGIAISELSQTFQDAIFTTRSLDIGLLWIDSLCIFQDSELDWQQESALMSQVYSNSTLNIAASIAADSDAGCFPERTTSFLDPCFVHTDWDDHANGSYRLCQKTSWNETIAERSGHLQYWIIQNLWLSFGPIPIDLLYEVFGNSYESMPMQRRSQDSKRAPWQLWRDIVAMYTGCNLTYTSDKLVALSGIAKIMERLFDDEYCAGLWKSRLHIKLGWKPSHPKIELEWTATADRTGAVIGGTLRIFCRLATIRFLSTKSSTSFATFKFNEKLLKSRMSRGAIDAPHHIAKLHFLILTMDPDNAYGGDQSCGMECLFLVLAGTTVGQFRRVGCMSNWKEFASVKNQDWFEYEKDCGDGKYIISII